MTGPLAFFTTSRSAETFGLGAGSAGGAAVLAALGAAGEQPVITLAAPTTAVRIRNARRSKPAGTSRVLRSITGGNEASLSFLASMAPFIELVANDYLAAHGGHTIYRAEAVPW